MYRLKKTHKITKVRERVRYKEREIKRQELRDTWLKRVTNR